MKVFDFGQSTHSLLIALILLSPPTFANSLLETVKTTLDTHPDVLSSQASKQVIEQQVKQARAGYLPSIDLQAGYGREFSENATTHQRYIDEGGDVQLNRSELSLSLTQMLFDGFATSANVNQQLARFKAADYRVSSTRENTALNAIEAHLEVLRRQELLELAKDNLVVHQKILEQIRLVVESGAGRRADLQQTTSRLALAKATLINAQGNLRDAEITYQRVVGKLAQQLEHPEKNQITPAMPQNLNQALDDALQLHPLLKATQSDLNAAQAEKEGAKAAFMPKIALELEGSRNDNLDGVDDKNNDWQAMLRMRYNLYRGGADRARQQAASHQIDIAQESIVRTQRLIEEEVRLAWNSLETARERLTYLNEHVNSAKEVVEAYREQFKLGQRNLLDVLDAENELFNARSSLSVGQFVELLGIYRVLGSQGRLLNTLGLARE